MRPPGQQVIALVAILLSHACCGPDVDPPAVARERVRNATSNLQAQGVLKMWNKHLTRAQDFADRREYRRSIDEYERALRLVTLYDISEEGGTWHSAYTMLGRVGADEIRPLLSTLLGDDQLVETKGAIILQAQEYVQLDAETAEHLTSMSNTKQAEILRSLLMKPGERH